MDISQPLIQEAGSRGSLHAASASSLEDHEAVSHPGEPHETVAVADEPLLSMWALFRLTWRVELAALLLGASTGIIAPLMPDVQKDAFGDHAYTATGSLGAVLGMVSFFVIPFVGGLGDRIGRPYALGAALCVYLLSFAPMVVHPWERVYLIVYAFLGFSRPLVSVLFSYIADVVRHRRANRATALSLPLLFMFMGLMVASLVSRTVYHRLGLVNVYRAGLAVSIGAVVYVFLVLPNVKTEAQLRHEEEAKEAKEAGVESPSAWQRLKHLAGATKGALARHPSLRYMLPACFFNNIAEQTLFSLIGLFLKNVAGFTPTDQSLTLVVLCLASIASYLIVVPLSTRRVGPVFMLRVSMFTNVIVMLTVPFARHLWQVCLILLLVAVSFGVFPCSTAILAWEADTHGTADNIGLLVGLLAASRLLAESIAPPLLGMMLDRVQHTSVPGSPFFICAAAALLGGLLTFGIPRDCDRAARAMHAPDSADVEDAA